MLPRLTIWYECQRSHSGCHIRSQASILFAKLTPVPTAELGHLDNRGKWKTYCQREGTAPSFKRVKCHSFVLPEEPGNPWDESQVSGIPVSSAFPSLFLNQNFHFHFSCLMSGNRRRLWMGLGLESGKIVSPVTHQNLRFPLWMLVIKGMLPMPVKVTIRLSVISFPH